MIETLASIVNMLAVLIAACVAIYGINSWKREMIGRRKAEVAERAIATFYEARDIIRWARFPGGYAEEGKSRPRDSDESDRASRDLDSFYLPVERLSKEHDFFSSLESTKYNFMALFGPSEERHFAQIKAMRDKIILSAMMLIQSRKDRDHLDEHVNKDRYAAMYDDIHWSGLESDKITMEVDQIVAAVEKICDPILIDRYTLGAGSGVRDLATMYQALRRSIVNRWLARK